MSWRLEFGSGPVHPGYALALGYRAADPALPATELVAVDISDHAALARLAGIPLVGRSYRTDLSDLDQAEADLAPRPWYARQWVLWTAGGLAATAALAGSGSGSETTNNNSGGCSGDCGVSLVSGDVVGPNDLCAADGSDAETCVDGPLVAASSRAGLAEPHPVALDEGTGGMGDLVAH